MRNVRRMRRMRNEMDLLRYNVADKVYNKIYGEIDVKVFGRGQIYEQVCVNIILQMKTNLKFKV